MSILAITLLVWITQLSGGEFNYVVRTGDSLTTVGARFGVDVRVIAETNGLGPTAKLPIGQLLHLDNRHIVPASRGVVVIVNIPQRMLFFYRDGHVFREYPVAAGKPSWRTPIVPFTVQSMERDPTWDVPFSIQEEMRREGKAVVTQVPPSPENPLGKYWIGLSVPGIGLHGTNAPGSIYKLQTHGCIRLHPDDIEDLFTLVRTGDRGEIVYEPVLMARVNGTAVFLEVHPDVYKKGVDVLAVARKLAVDANLLDIIDWSAAEEVIRKRDGIARDVTRR